MLHAKCPRPGTGVSLGTQHSRHIAGSKCSGIACVLTARIRFEFRKRSLHPVSQLAPHDADAGDFFRGIELICLRRLKHMTLQIGGIAFQVPGWISFALPLTTEG